jgi:hypothetical protein
MPGDGTQIYFILSSQFQPRELDVDKLLEFAELGHIVFISSERIDPKLLDTLGVRMRFEYTGSLGLTDWVYEDNLDLSLSTRADTSWPVATASGYMRFEPADSSVAFDTLGIVDDEYPNFISRPFGKGRIFLHAFPVVFTNYHMLYRDNHQYISSAIGSIPHGDTWLWDQYYNTSHLRKASSPLAVFNRYLSFRWAYWISVVGLIIFILFTAKRRQRVIPIVKSKRNMTLDFVRTIGDLYFQRRDHADLIEKKLDLLRNYIYKTYRIEVTEFSADNASRVALRSGLPLDQVRECFAFIRNLPPKSEQRSRTVWGLQHQLDRFLNRTQP